MLGIIIRWLLTAVAIWLTATIFPNWITISNAGAALVAALMLGLVNAIVRPIVTLMTLPVTFLTLGLFLLVINAAMLGLAALFAGKGFEVHGFWGALFASIVISLFSLVLNMLVGEKGAVQKLTSGYDKK
jgi:putative membrane protein